MFLTRVYCNRIPTIKTFIGSSAGSTLFFLSGSHGNEPAGSFALSRLINDINTHKINLFKGKLIILPRANCCGLALNSRTIPFTGDLNRMYPYPKHRLKFVSPIAKTILNLVNSSDFVLDLHEGWGYRKENQKSMGSTIASINMDLKSIEDLANKLNSKITDPSKKFMIMTTDETSNLPRDNELYTFYTIVKGSLTDYCDSIKKSHILVEVTGQHDIQPLELRIQQCYTVIMHLLEYYGLIKS